MGKTQDAYAKGVRLPTDIILTLSDPLDDLARLAERTRDLLEEEEKKLRDARRVCAEHENRVHRLRGIMNRYFHARDVLRGLDAKYDPYQFR